MKALICAALFGISLANLARPEAHASKESIDMRCFLVFDENWQGGQKNSSSTPPSRNIRIAVVIKNLDKQDVSIATGAQPRLTSSPDSSLVYLGLLKSQSYDGETRVPSIVEVMPSVLRFGEVAIIHADVRVQLRLVREFAPIMGVTICSHIPNNQDSDYRLSRSSSLNFLPL